MLHAGLDLSRRKVDVCLLSQSGEHVDQLAAPPDADAQVALTGNTWTQAGDEMNVAWLKAKLTNNACVGGPRQSGRIVRRVERQGGRHRCGTVCHWIYVAAVDSVPR